MLCIAFLVVAAIAYTSKEIRIETAWNQFNRRPFKFVESNKVFDNCSLRFLDWKFFGHSREISFVSKEAISMQSLDVALSHLEHTLYWPQAKETSTSVIDNYLR